MKKEKEEEIVVLDEGIDPEAITVTKGICCTGPVAPFRS